MKIEITPQFKFKGSRTYVHGTDLYNYATSYIKELNLTSVTKVSATFHSILETQADGYITDEEVKDTNIAFQFTFKDCEKDYKLVLYKNDKTIDERYDYPEESIVELCSLDCEKKLISLNQSIAFSNVEKLVAMNKSLLETLFPDAKGKWYFTRLQLSEGFNQDTYERYSVKLIKNLNFKLTKSEIYLNDELVGYIYFSLV